MRFASYLISAAIVLCSILPAASQADLLAPDYLYGFPDARQSGGAERYDPLSIDPLLRPIDPQHTSEYLEWLRARGIYPYRQGLAGSWTLELQDGDRRRLDLLLVQNGRAVFGRGSINSSSAAAASGTISGSLVYLDVISMDDLTLYRGTLNLGQDRLSGSYYAFTSQGGFQQGRISGTRKSG